METISEQWEKVEKIKVFEIEVIDLKTNKIDYLLFDISIHKNQFKAIHKSLSQEQADSPYISFVATDIDEDISLDENLSELYDKCINAIINSEFYKLSD